MSTYSLQNAARILKVAPSRLRYWKRTRLAMPRAGPSASASPDDYEFRDLLGIRAVLSLLESGISLQRVRRSLEVLHEVVPELEDPLVALRLWGDGSRRVVLEHQGRLMEPDGQILLDFESGGGDEVAVTPIVRSQAPAAPAPSAPDPSADAASESPGDWFERGCQLDADPARFRDAVIAYERAVALDPDFADAHCNLGALHYNAGDREAARRGFERCLRIEPGHVEAHFNLANLLEEDGCNDMALHHYRAGLLADPFYPDLHINLALLYEKMELPVRARDHWRRYLQLEPGGSWSEVAKLRLDRA